MIESDTFIEKEKAQGDALMTINMKQFSYAIELVNTTKGIVPNLFNYTCEAEIVGTPGSLNPDAANFTNDGMKALMPALLTKFNGDPKSPTLDSICKSINESISGNLTQFFNQA